MLSSLVFSCETWQGKVAGKLEDGASGAECLGRAGGEHEGPDAQQDAYMYGTPPTRTMLRTCPFLDPPGIGEGPFLFPQKARTESSVLPPSRPAPGCQLALPSPTPRTLPAHLTSRTRTLDAPCRLQTPLLLLTSNVHPLPQSVSHYPVALTHWQAPLSMLL